MNIASFTLSVVSVLISSITLAAVLLQSSKEDEKLNGSTAVLQILEEEKTQTAALSELLALTKKFEQSVSQSQKATPP